MMITIHSAKSDIKYDYIYRSLILIHYSINLKHKELPVVFQIAFLKMDYMEVKKNLELPDNISVIECRGYNFSGLSVYS